MAVPRRYDIVAIVAIVVGIVAYASLRSEFRLRSSMPAEFFDNSRVSPENRISEERIAKAYWKCAVTQVQWRYGYAHRLPEEPPFEFSVTVEQAGKTVAEAAARARYWQRLRDEWGLGGVWEVHYEWNTISLTESLRSAGEWLERHMRQIVGDI